MKRNPQFEAAQFVPPSWNTPEAKKQKEDPEARLPWRMFAAYGRRFCKNCQHERPAAFVVARSRASADKVFEKGNGLCPSCMCAALQNPNDRIVVLDGGLPNPTRIPVRVSGSSGPPVQYGPEQRRRIRDISPYRLWLFVRNRPIRCACGGMRTQLWAIAADYETALKREPRYGMCALCMCEYLTFDRFAFETLDGGPP